MPYAIATDLRASLRRLKQSLSFTIATVLVLGLGLGANIILFNTSYALLWRPLNFPQPERLVSLCSRNSKGVMRSGAPITGTQAAALANHVGSLAEIGLVTNAPRVAVFAGDDILDLVTARVNSGYFETLGLHALAGRLFSEEEDRGENAELRAVLLESAWRRYFGGDSTIVGRLVWYDTGAERQPMRILGIVEGNNTLPFASGAEVLLPIPWRSAAVQQNFGDAVYRCVSRLKPNTSVDRTSTEVQWAFTELDRKTAAAGGTRELYWAEPLRSVIAPPNTNAILLLASAASLLLIVMCANLASLFLARAMERAQDSSVRLALGASWRDLMVNSSIESVLLCLAGTLVAFCLNSLSRPWALALVPDLKRIGPELLTTSPVLLLFGGALCLTVAVVSALPSSLYAARAGISSALSRSSRGTTARANRWTRVLVTAQLSIVLTLLTLGSLMGRSFVTALRADRGFDSHGVVTFRVSIPVKQSELSESAASLARQIASTSGVQGAAFAAEGPLESTYATVMRAGEGKFAPTDPLVPFRMIGPQYFETLGAHLIAGRTFSEEEVLRGDAIVILNEAAAHILFGGANAIGRSVQTGFLGLNNRVVGVVKNIQHEALDKSAGPMAYLPYRPIFAGSVSLVARLNNVKLLRSVLNARVSTWNPRASVRQFEVLDDAAEATVEHRLRSGMLIGGFAILGLAISSLGVYGTLAMEVQRRRREIGVRTALGASPAALVRMILSEGAQFVAAGVALGLAGSLSAAYMIRTLLYGVGTVDSVSLISAVAILSAAQLFACLVPARSALRVDPAEALRAE